MTKEENKKLEFFVGALLKKPNLRKFGFPKTKVLKLFKKFIAENPKFDYRNANVFVCGYNTKKDDCYVECEAIVRLIAENCEDDSVVVSTKKNKKAFLLGKGADEFAEKAEIDWDNAHLTASIAKVPCKMPVKRKMKCFGGKKIHDMMKEIEKEG